MKTRTLIVDSSYLLKRSFFGGRDLQTTKFGNIGGLYSFFTIIRKLTKKYMINKVILVWDGEGGGVYRYNIDKHYKSNRKNKEWHIRIELNDFEIKREKEKEESILKQKLRIQAYAEELFFRQIQVDDIEADDIIASYCLNHHNSEEIIIVTNDRDFNQLLDLNISIDFQNIDELVTKYNYFMYFKHHYLNSLTLKIICGDKSDNIIGIEGLGENTLLKYFPELEYKYMSVNDILKKAKEINEDRINNKKKPLKCFENLLKNKKRLIINHKLINLKDPILNDEAIKSLNDLELPLSSDNRGSKYLIKMMKEDDFLSVYGGNFVQYVEPFYTIISSELSYLKNYLNK